MERVARRLLCLVRGHAWELAHDRETQGTRETCRRCGKQRFTFPGGDGGSRQRERGGGTDVRGPVGGWDA